jgi:lysophospholipase L1-like esterase
MNNPQSLRFIGGKPKAGEAFNPEIVTCRFFYSNLFYYFYEIFVNFRMKASKTFLFIVSILLLLGIISLFFPKKGIAFGERQLYFPTIEDILTKRPGLSTTASQRMKEMEKSLRMKHLQDSITKMAYYDSLAFYIDFFQNHPSRMCLPNDNWNYFNGLFERFDTCGKQNEIIHILHYGDSQIEGDRITGYIRQKLQEKFGGKGPGLLPAVQPIPSSTVAQFASENIERYIVSGNLQNRISNKRYGALGQVGVVSGESFISVQVRNWKQTFENVKEFRKIRLFVGHPSPNFRADLVISNHKTIKQKIKDKNKPVHILTWELDKPVKKFTLNLHGLGEIYGMAVDGTAGIAVDNIPFRGSSGTFFTTMDSIILGAMLQELNAQMILLEFGGNMTPSIKNEKSIENYKNKMSNQIVLLKRLCPKAKIILIGPADMSTKINGKLQSYPYLAKIIDALKETALQNNIAFWNMYEVMGGQNSMIDWVKNAPPLAATDYIHFSTKGAEKIAGLFYESLMIYYDYYNFEKEKKDLKALKGKEKEKGKKK